jgi:ribosomal protein S21
MTMNQCKAALRNLKAKMEKKGNFHPITDREA